MLKKENRIAKQKEFDEVREKGKMYQSPIFGLIIKNEGYMGAADAKAMAAKKKFGFIISKKISKRAVDRNKIKRLLAEAVRKNLEKIPEGTRGIFLAKRAILGKKYEEIGREVKKIISEFGGEG